MRKPTSKSKTDLIGITIGDPAGVGPEVVAKALRDPSLKRLAQFVIIGDKKTYLRYGQRAPSGCAFIDLKASSPRPIVPGKPDRHTAKAAFSYLEKAVELLKHKEITALVTAPVSKDGIASLGVNFRGHTEYLAKAFRSKDVGMMFVAKTLKTLIVTRHIPLGRVKHNVTKQSVYNAIVLADGALKRHFKLPRPVIAVCGLNPHAGEGGKLGDEELKIIIPAIKKAQHKGIRVKGPFPADTIFEPEISKGYDLIVAMYHDQGLIAPKAMHFSTLVNLTIGLPFIRTSPAHGTAFNIAGKNKADPGSMKEAIRLAAQLSL